MVMTPRIGELFVEWPSAVDDRTLGVVDFSIFPHLDAFPTNTIAEAERWAADLGNPAYAIDEQTAITAGGPGSAEPRAAAAGCTVAAARGDRGPERWTSGGGGHAAEAAAVEDQGPGGVGLRDGVQLQQHDRVVTGDDLVVDRALEAGQPVVEGERAVVGRRGRQTGEAVLHRAGELAADLAVVVGQDRDAE
eukprot:gene3392-4006_t